MKISTKIISLAALAILACTPASRAADDTTPPPAGQQPGPRMKHLRENRMKQLDEKLHLTAEQKTQIKAIWDKSAEQGRALRADKSVARENRREKMRAILAATHQEVRGVLTPEQQKIFDTIPAEEPRRGPPPPSAEPAPAPAPAAPPAPVKSE